jgi:hypothetical protein
LNSSGTLVAPSNAIPFERRCAMKRFLFAFLAIVVSQHLADGPFVRFVAAREKHQEQRSSGATPAIGELQIPDGTPIDIESPFTYSSLDLKPKDEISFRVLDPVIVDGVTVIAQGATVTGHVERAKRGGHFGKAGLLVWTMKSVTAVDGSQIELRLAPVRQRGDSKSAKVATQMIITGALVPFIAPVALLHGFKRGGDAYIAAGKRYQVFVKGAASVVVK